VLCLVSISSVRLTVHVVELAIANIKEVDWKQAALDNLYIPAKTKKAVQALSEAYSKRVLTNVFDDIIEGKGQGFNVLLQ